MGVWEYEKLFEEMDPPFDSPPEEDLRGEFPKELELVSRLWFESGYRPGIVTHLNLVLLRELIVTHDRAFPRRFRTLHTMRRSFYETDKLLREITDSGKKPTGGISSPQVRSLLAFTADRSRKASIPRWMTTYFAFSFVESVERACEEVADNERQLHLAYMTKAFRIMGVAFSSRRELMEDFSRRVEQAHTGRSPNLEKHARHALLLGEMLGVSSEYDQLAPLLPERPRSLFREIYPKVRPDSWQRNFARASGRFLAKQALGARRRAVQVTAWRRPALPETADRE